MPAKLSKSLPKTEIVWLTMYCSGGKGGEEKKKFVITSNATRLTYNLWLSSDEGYAKIASASEPTKLYEKMK